MRGGITVVSWQLRQLVGKRAERREDIGEVLLWRLETLHRVPRRRPADVSVDKHDVTSCSPVVAHHRQLKARFLQHANWQSELRCVENMEQLEALGQCIPRPRHVS